MVMLKVAVLVAVVAGVSALHPSMRLLSEGVRQTVEVGRLLGAAEDAIARAAVTKCVVAMMPPSITSFSNCFGIDLALVAVSDGAATAAAEAAIADIQKQVDTLASFKTISKDSCTTLFSTKLVQCTAIMFTSDPAAYLEKNPFPTSVAALPAGCADAKTLLTQNPGVSARSDRQLNNQTAQGVSNELKTDCGAQANGKSGFSEGKAAFAQIFSECSKTGVNTTSQLSTEDAKAVNAALGALGAPTNAAGLVASVVLAAVAVVVAL